MPFIRKTPRRPSRHVITLSQLTESNWQVTTEMERLGLWHDALDDVDVYLVPVSFCCYGWFLPDGHIYIPGVTGAQLSDLITGHHTRLTDVLRHEWAHALADRRPELVNHDRFHRTFGGPYESPHPVWRYDPDQHLTKYAATQPCEDFAETFHHYLRHKGRLPVRLHQRPAIIRKWEFMEWMAARITRYSHG
jgi:hypothetical protein